MNRWFVLTFLAWIVTGCVTVTERELTSDFDNIRAADARIELGLGYLEAGNRTKAQENLELAIKYAPNHYRSLNSIAYYYQLVGEVDSADHAYRKGLRGSPENIELLNNYGAFLCQLEQYEKADALFTRAIEQPFNYLIVDSLENAAICLLKSGNKTEAERYFERSLGYDPYRYFSLLQWSRLKLSKREYNEVRIRLIEFHKMFGYQASSLALLIEIEKSSGDIELADNYAKLLEQHYPDYYR